MLGRTAAQCTVCPAFCSLHPLYSSKHVIARRLIPKRLGSSAQWGNLLLWPNGASGFQADERITSLVGRDTAEQGRWLSAM